MKPPSIRPLVAPLLALQTCVAFAQPVEIQQGSEIGAGYAFRRGELCLVLTALHVVPSDVAEVAVLDRTGARNAAQRTYGNPSHDLALLEVTGKPAIACHQNWPDSAWLASASPGSRSVFEAVRHYPSGSRETLIALRHAGGTANTFTLAPVDRTTIRESDSGAIVRLDDKLAGIVQSVDPKTDRVEVLRLDVIDKLIGERFRGSGLAPLAVEGVRNRGQVQANWTAYLRTWVTEGIGRQAVAAQDPAAKCSIAVDLMELRAAQVPNPDFERANAQDCTLMKALNKSLGANCEAQKRKSLSGTPRVLPAYLVSADVKVQPVKGPARSKVVSGTVPIEAKRATRSMDEQFSALETVMAPAARELIAQSGCE